MCKEGGGRRAFGKRLLFLWFYCLKLINIRQVIILIGMNPKHYFDFEFYNNMKIKKIIFYKTNADHLKKDFFWWHVHDKKKNKQILCRGGTELTILVVVVVSWTHNQEEVRVQIDVDDAKQKKKIIQSICA